MNIFTNLSRIVIMSMVWERFSSFEQFLKKQGIKMKKECEEQILW